MAVSSCRIPKERIREGRGVPVRAAMAARVCLYAAKRPLGWEAMVAARMQTNPNHKIFSATTTLVLSRSFSAAGSTYNGFMLSQALRTRQQFSPYRLQLHQRFNHKLKSTPTSTPKEEETHTPVRFKKDASRTAFIRTWEPFHHLADAWTLLRVIERKYGRVAEAHFLKVSL